MSGLNQIIMDTLKVNPTDVHKNLSKHDVEQWDSLAHLELIAAIEKYLSIELSVNEIVSLQNFEQIRALGKSKRD